MLSFEKEFPGCRKVCLPINFRSDQEIVRASQLLIRDNSHRFAKKTAAHSTAEGRILLRPFPGREEEYNALLEELKESTSCHGVPDDFSAYSPMMQLFLQKQMPKETEPA